MNALRIQKIGNSAGVILPKELLAHLRVAIGESVAVVRTPHGVELRSPDSDFGEQMERAREVMSARRRALRELAK